MIFFRVTFQCFGFLLVDEAEGSDSCALVGRMCQMGATAILATKISLRLSLSSIQLPVTGFPEVLPQFQVFSELACCVGHAALAL